MICPSCQAENDERAEVCFTCRSVLAAVTQGTVVGGRYDVARFLGRGGMGAVYLAQDRLLDEPVALKILRADLARAPEMARRFRAEIKLARQVSHPNVCRIHEYGEDGGLQYISMELVTGEDLRALVGRRGPLPPAEACALGVQIAEGLAAIHRTGIVHRDLKSSNVMVDAMGRARVMDFGIAKQMAESATGSGTGYVMGSPEYMSPEQARGRRSDARSDLYSLGVVLFELLTGDVPFRGDSPVATLLRHLSDAPPLEGAATAGWPPPLRDLLRSALAKEPDQRPGSAEQMASKLRAVLGPSPTQPTAGRRHRSGRPLTRLVLPLLVLMIALASGLVWRGRTSDSAPPAPGPTSDSARPGPMLTRPAPTTPAAHVAEPQGAPRVPATVPDSVRPTPSAPPRATAPPAPTSATLDGEAFPTLALPPTSSPPATATTLPPSPSPSSEPAPVENGWLRLSVVPWADVFVDGRQVGQTPLGQLSLPPGAHAVTLLHPGYQPYHRRVTIEPGQVFPLKLDFTADGVPAAPR